MARHQREETGTGVTGGARSTIRRRLARILALPLITVVGLLAVVVADDLAAYRSASATVQAVELTLEVQRLVEELQHERGLANNVLGGDVSFAAELPRARGLVDDQLDRLDRLAVGDSPEARATSAALAELTGLTDLRRQVDTDAITRGEAFAYFTDRITTLSGINFGLDSSNDPDLRRSVTALQSIGEVKEHTAQSRAFLSGVLAAGGFSREEYLEYASIRAQQQAAIGRFQRYADPEQAQLLDRALDTGAAREAQFFEDRALAAVTRPFVVSPQSWWSSHTTIIDDMRLTQERVGDDVSVLAAGLQDRAATRLGGLSALALISMLGAIVIVIVAARSITRPLAALAAEAREMATERLPAAVQQIQEQPDDTPAPPPAPVAVPYRPTAEILDVVEALNSAQSTAYALASEQALLRRSTTESLANLGRRNQNLLRRQLGFITQLERDEVDPAGLANLFELDHLATRMRRNAESLLVLVGESSPRSWSQPLPVGDVLRAAISEVEDYRRVTLRRVDDAFVSGAAVAGIAHMIAELVENGLAFSPPDTDVEIQGRMLAGRYVIGITDQGIGMSTEAMAEANSRLRGEGSFLTAPTRYLGHFVVGHLVRQLGVQVALTPSPVTGVTAQVTLPESILESLPALPEREPTDTTELSAIDAGRATTLPPVEYRPAPGPAPPAAPLPATVMSVPGASPSWNPAPTGPDPVVPASLPLAAPTVPAGFATPDPATPPVVVSVQRVGNEAATSLAHGGGERTRNGLLKRVSRVRATTLTPTGGGPEPTGEPSLPEPSPEAQAAALRSSLTALRAGVARGRDLRNRDNNAGSDHDG